MRILLYTGKGGVGKTSTSAATAVYCADLGYRTLVISTDSAHSLADALDMPLGADPLPITENLWGQELDVLVETEKYWGSIKRYIASTFSMQGVDKIIAEEFSLFPGMEEITSLIHVANLHDTGDYDVVVIDCAPTGATLQLLTLPEIIQWYLEKLMPLGKRVLPIGKSLIRSLTDIRLPDEAEVQSALDKLIGQLKRMQSLLTDRKRSSVRIVLNPEKMVIKEAQRAYMYLNLYGYPTDAIICNRLLPPAATGAYFDDWRAIHTQYRQRIEESFYPLPILDAPLFQQEMVGIDRLRQMGQALFAGRDPTDIFYVGEEQHIVETEDGYTLYVPLPMEQGKIRLNRPHLDELVVYIGNRKRILTLPHTLAKMQIKEAEHKEDRLVVAFCEM
ncbi:MAG: TRC40/GET3/ArsA family transport-energizing ATPase [Anaerolineae bacterium]|nr:TRC40/GET3/ArsA family transport-energizing ATPase [Anaerolineae bacterium]